MRPRALLMDEPCSALDPTSTRRIEETIGELANDVTIGLLTAPSLVLITQDSSTEVVLVDEVRGCSMLQIDPKRLDRLAEVEADLLHRRELAETEGWLGEIEGIDLTLVFLRDKRTEANHLEQREPVDVGMPAIRTSETR